MRIRLFSALGLALAVLAPACDTDEASDVTSTSARLNLKLTGNVDCDAGCSFFWEYTTNKSLLEQAGSSPSPSLQVSRTAEHRFPPSPGFSYDPFATVAVTSAGRHYFRLCGRVGQSADVCASVKDFFPGGKVGIIGSGQSLSVGADSVAISTTAAPGSSNKKLYDPSGAYDDTTTDWQLVPLVEPIRSLPSAAFGAYPRNIAYNEQTQKFGETPHTAMGNQLTAIDPANVTWHTVVGRSGMAMAGLNRGSAPYLASLREVRTFKRLALAEGSDYDVGGILFTHGEADWDNPAYGDALLALHDAYNTDIKNPATGTGQSRGVPLLITQQHTFPGPLEDNPLGPTAHSTRLQWQAANDNPGKIVLVGPKYQYQYVGIYAFVHLDGPSYRRLGQKYAQVFNEVYRKRRAWKPLQPSRVTRSGTTVTIDYHVPAGALNFDPWLPRPFEDSTDPAYAHWRGARGFEAQDAAGRIGIRNVTIADANTVTFSLTREPSGPLTVSYATSQNLPKWLQGTHDVNTPTSPKTHYGRVGHLRDGDGFIGDDRESITVTCGSGGVITATGGKTFAKRTLRDLVTGGGLVGETVIVSLTASDPTTATLSAPCSGTQTLTFRHDHRNYGVSFTLSVPYTAP
jgi:hypothetical protein